MPAIGITGGVSTGKSSLVDCLRELFPQARFFDADAKAGELTRSNPDVLTRIRDEFGADVFFGTGELNRAALRAIVFSAPRKRRALEEILHPQIRQHWSGEAEKHRHTSDLFFADIPLLYETHGEKLCNLVVVVACSEEIQIQRLMKRTGLDQDSAIMMVRAQMPLAEKVRRGDHVIWNNGPRSVLAEQARFLASLWIAR